MINYLIKILKELELINKRLDKLENRDKSVIGTRTNRAIRVNRPTINGGR